MQFPIKVRLIHSGEVHRVSRPEDLPQGVSLEILGPSSYTRAEAAYYETRHDREESIKLIENWMDLAERAQRDAAYYRDTVTEIGNMFDVIARTSDDGTVQDSVLAEKVPGLVQAALDAHRQLKTDYFILAQRMYSIVAIVDDYRVSLEWRLSRVRSVASADISRH